MRLSDRCPANVQGQVHAHFSREFKTVIINVGNHDVPRSRMPGNRRGHYPNGSSPGDQHIFADNVEGEGRVNCVAKRIEDGCHIAIDAGIVPPDVGHRQRNELRETSRPVDAYSRRVGAQMTPPGHAVAATAANDVPFA